MVLIAFPPNIVAAAPIVLTNGQNVATPAPFQQMVSVNMLKYSSYAAPNLQNIEFFYTDGTLIPSWLESGSSSTTAIWWLSIANGIGANSSLTVYMGFALQSVNLFDGVNVGEAPQLSATYGQYDNGAKVFSFYDNFAGTSLSSKWTDTSGTPVVNNGLTLSYPSYIGEGSYSAPSFILDFYADITADSTIENFSYGFITNNEQYTPSVVFNQNNIVPSSNNGYAYPWVIFSNTERTFLPNGVVGTHVYSVYWNTSICKFWWDYANEQSSTTTIPAGPLPIGFFANQGSGTTFVMTWVRTRAYPPNGTMPGVTADPPLDACAGPTYPLIVAQIVRPSLAPKGVSPKANTGSLLILQNACPAPAETLAQAQQQLANQKYLTPAYTITLLGA